MASPYPSRTVSIDMYVGFRIRESLDQYDGHHAITIKHDDLLFRDNYTSM